MLGLVLGSAAASAATPAWVAAAAQISVPGKRPAAVLFKDTTVTYLTGERTHRRYRYAYRLIEETPRAAARFTYGYNPDTTRILSASVWIIPPDGLKIKSYHQADFQDVAASDHVIWNHNRVLAFDGTDKLPLGGTLVGEIEAEDLAGVYEVTESFVPTAYTLEHALEVAPPSGMKLIWRASSANLPQPVPGGTPGSLRWEARRQSLPRDNELPKSFLPNHETIVVRPEAGDRPLTWSDVSRLAASVVEPQLAVTDSLKAAALRLGGSATGRWERIRALTEFVQSQIVYLSLTDDTDLLAGSRPHQPDQVLANRYGDCKDKSGLLVALLRAMGEDGRVLFVTLGDPRAVDADWPSLSFNHAIAAIPADDAAPASWPRIDGGPLGQMIVFDPTDSNTPLGVLRPFDQSGWALLIDAKNGKLVRLPEAQGPNHSVDTSAQAAVSADGGLKATVDKEYRGVPAAEAYAFRAASRKDQIADSFARQLKETVPLVDHLTWTDQWNPAQADYKVHLEFLAERYGRHLGAILLAISPRIGSGISDFPEWKSSREGVSWLSTGEIHWNVKLKIPDGYAVEELPDNWDSTGATVSSHLAYAKQPGEVTYDSRFSIKPGFYNRERYEAIRQFILKFHEAERRPILLRRATAAPATDSHS